MIGQSCGLKRRSNVGARTQAFSRAAWAAVVSAFRPRVLILLCMVVFVGSTGVASASELNLTGTWNANYHCEVGWCAGQDFPAPGAKFIQAPGSSHVDIPPSASGTLIGNVLTVNGKEGSYTYTETLTISADGNSWSGHLSDSHGTEGTDTGTRVGRASTTQVNCSSFDPGFANEYFQCTAQVGDASGQSPAGTPTGTVAFAVNSGAEGALQSSTCTLAPSQTGGASSFCAVNYWPPAVGIPVGAQPPIAATYSGDSVFAASSAQPEASVFETNATDCEDASNAVSPEAATASIRGPVGRASLNSPSMKYQNSDTFGEKLAKTGALPIRLVGTCLAGVVWGGGKLAEVAGSEPVADAQAAVGTAMIVGGWDVAVTPSPITPVGLTVAGAGAVVLVDAGLNHYVVGPAGAAAANLAKTVIKDPPDRHFHLIPRSGPVRAVVLPAGSPAALRDLGRLTLLARSFTATERAMVSAINRAGGAKAAHNPLWEGRQMRAALGFDRTAVADLRQILALEPKVQAEVASVTAAIKPLTSAQIARAKTSVKKHGLGGRLTKILSAFGISPASVRADLNRAKPGTRAAAVPASPYLRGMTRLLIAALTSYPKVAQIESEAALR
jgi:hypothetical protein